MNAAQREAAMQLLQVVLSPKGYRKVLDIMGSDQALADAGTRTFPTYQEAVRDALSTAQSVARNTYARARDQDPNDISRLHPEVGGFIFSLPSGSSQRFAYVYSVSPYADLMPQISDLFNQGIAFSQGEEAWGMFHTHQDASYTNVFGDEVNMPAKEYSGPDENALRVFGSQAFGPDQPNPWFTSYIRTLSGATLSRKYNFP